MQYDWPGMMAGLYTLSASRRVYYSCIYKFGEREERKKEERKIEVNDSIVLLLII